MAAEHPSGSAAEFASLLRASMDDLLLKTNAQKEAWGFGEEEQWSLDYDLAEIVFTLPEGVARAPAQVIGSFNTETSEWTWSWTDPSVPGPLKTDALAVRQYGQEHGFQHLLTPTWKAEETHCWYMAALACWLCHAHGVYRGANGNHYTYLTFGEVLANPSSGAGDESVLEDLTAQTAEDFKACALSPETQREACCRYLKRGAQAGIPQSELIHLLGLSAPSVLDLAGYPPDAAETVMDLLKTITDEEIESCAV